MKNTKKAFTLVELIVVITILAILATVAFISLQGYSQDAKNSKVLSDIRTLNSAVETGLTKGEFILPNLVNDNVAHHITGTGTITYKTLTGANATVAITSANTYVVGNINFGTLRQNGDDFKDPEGNDYLIGVVGHEGTVYYEIAGQTKAQDGTYASVVNGNFVKISSTDANGLIMDKTGTQTNGVGDRVNLGTTGLY